jgi:peptide subunit release factor RF-3
LKLTTSGVLRVKDRLGREVLLFESPWELRYVMEGNPEIRFHDSM